MNLLGELIKDYRHENDLSLRDFAERCECSHSYIDKLEKGTDPKTGKEVLPTIDILQRIAKAMNMHLDVLLIKAGYLETVVDHGNYKEKTIVTVDGKIIDSEILSKAEEMQNIDPELFTTMHRVITELKPHERAALDNMAKVLLKDIPKKK